jgi:transcription termination factor Rho
MSEPKRPTTRGRRPRSSDSQAADGGDEPNPYRDVPADAGAATAEAPAARPKRPSRRRTAESSDGGAAGPAAPGPDSAPPPRSTSDAGPVTIAPSGGAPSGSAPSGSAPSGSAPSGSAPSPSHIAAEGGAAAALDAGGDRPRGRGRGRGRGRRGHGRDGGGDPSGGAVAAETNAPAAAAPSGAGSPGGQPSGGGGQGSAPAHEFRNGRRSSRRGRGRFRKDRPNRGAEREVREPRDQREFAPPTIAETPVVGWFDSQRDAGFLRRAQHSYLPEPTDPFVQPHLVRQHNLRRGDKIEATWGRDHRGRSVVIEILALNDGPPVVEGKRPDFNTLVASYPDRKLGLETGQPAKFGPELTRRAIDLIAPIGYGQRALIVAPARAGKTTLLQAIVQGVATNHPAAELFVLLVDERPEEVSEMITWGYGEVVASSFDMPAKRHVEVADMVLERARRLVEKGKDVVIVLDSITRLARAHNTVERGTGRTLSGGLDSSAMQKPKAFFGSARMIAPEHGGGSLTIIATALVETGSRMDDVIFEEFKGTGNCEIKLDRSLADRRIYPAIDIAVSGTRREEKLYRPDQVQKVHLLRRGLAQMPPQAGMEWLIKRIAATSNNDSLLDGL